MSTSRRYELSDFEWSIIEPLLPNKPRGVPRQDDRRVLNGVKKRIRTPHQPPLGTTLEPSAWGARAAG